MADRKRLLSWREPMGRRDYLAAGALLMTLKFALDWSLARFVLHREWTPFSYLGVSPPRRPGVVVGLYQQARDAFPFLLIALPFILAGVVLTMRRLRSAGLAVGWTLLFFVPWLNLLFFALLAAAPARRGATSTEPATPMSEGRRRVHEAVARREEQELRDVRRDLKAIGAGLVLTIVLVLFGVGALRSYGAGLFIGAPFLLGFVVAFVLDRDGATTFRHCATITGVTLLIAALVLLVVAIEGVICLAMAFPLALGLALLGALLGRAAAAARGSGTAYGFAPLVLAPLLMALDAWSGAEPPLRVVTTEIVVDASAEEVWRHVIAFPPLPDPADDWLFRAGIAAPLRATIDGEGVGAVRHCVFTTGAFVEPIDVWDPPRVLRFQVTDQPEPMREWSPYTIHPPHLAGFLVSRQGEFRLEAFGPDRTLLRGTTWYVNRMAPAAYWGLWSDAILHRIHRRVLDHVARLAEAEAPR